jgi:hypothetical protein
MVPQAPYGRRHAAQKGSNQRSGVVFLIEKWKLGGALLKKFHH